MRWTAVTLLALALFCTVYYQIGDIPTKSRLAVEDLGYSQVEYVGYTFKCGRGIYALEFSAKSSTGRKVNIAACSGLFTGVTVKTLD